MATIRTAVELNDSFSVPLMNIVNTVNQSMGVMEQMRQTMNSPIDTSSMEAVQTQIDQVTNAASQLEAAMQNVSSPFGLDIPEQIDVQINPVVTEQPQINVPAGLNVPVNPVVTEQPQINVPEHVEFPVTPVVTETPDLNIPESAPIEVQAATEAAQQQIAEIGRQLQDVNRMQEVINNVAHNAFVLPEETVQELNSVNREIRRMQAALEFIRDNPFEMDFSFATMQIEALSHSLETAAEQQRELNTQLGNLPEQVLSVRVNPDVPDPLVDQPEPVRIPVTWQSESLEIFTNTGIERFQSEVQSTNNLLNQLTSLQEQITQNAVYGNVLPPNAANDMINLQSRIHAIQQRIQAIENNPLNIGADNVNSELEQMRNQLYQAVEEQENLNRAIENMDIEAANQSYLRLSQTIGNTERYIRDNTGEQQRFNQEIRTGGEEANKLTDFIKGAIGAYATVQTVSSALDLSDQLTSTTARLSMMKNEQQSVQELQNIKDEQQSIQELQNMIFESAQRSRGEYQATADAVSKLGLMAGDAFNSSEEIVEFVEQLNKQFTIAGTEASGIEAAMLQLTQAMGSGILRGEEYNSILEQAPNIIQTIADYMGVQKGQLKDMAAEGQITADIVKAAMFEVADETNAKFESMPQTFEQIQTSLENMTLMALQPLLENLNDVVNNVAESDAFQTIVNNAVAAVSSLAAAANPIIERIVNSQLLWNFVNNAIGAISVVGNIALQIFDLLLSGVGIVADNWSWLSPIIYGVAAALAVYYGWQLAVNTIGAISKGIHAVLRTAQLAYAVATKASTAATAAETAAQEGLNVALSSCPIMLIIILIIALIAVIFAVCSAIAKFTGIANSGFGVICGGVMVVVDFFKNLGLSIANIALGIGSAIAALGSNIMTAFHNAICHVQEWWYNLLSTVLNVVAGICEALNKIPFISFDYSGITDAANKYAEKASEAAQNVREYKSIGDAFNEGFNTFDTFQEGWVSDAFASGAAWGDGITDKINSLLDGFENSTDDSTNTEDDGGLNDYGAGMYDDLSSISNNTNKIADGMDITEEDLKYLRDIAEQETINRFTTAEITIEQTNNNNVSGKIDLDGLTEGLTELINEAINVIPEGVHT